MTFWRDSDNDGQIESGEAVLCSETVTAKDVGECVFTVTVPPFQGGLGPPGDLNYINALDGRGQTASMELPMFHLDSHYHQPPQGRTR